MDVAAGGAMALVRRHPSSVRRNYFVSLTRV